MKEEESLGWVKGILIIIFLWLLIPYWLLKTIFNAKLDFGTRLSYAVLSLPSAMLLFFTVAVCGVFAALFIPVFLCSDAWPVGVYAILCVICVAYQFFKAMKAKQRNEVISKVLKKTGEK